jgi:hypothetical protein
LVLVRLSVTATEAATLPSVLQHSGAVKTLLEMSPLAKMHWLRQLVETSTSPLVGLRSAVPLVLLAAPTLPLAL